MACLPVRKWVLVFRCPPEFFLTCWTEICADISFCVPQFPRMKNISFSVPTLLLARWVLCARQGLGDEGFSGMWHARYPPSTPYGLATSDPLRISPLCFSVVHPPSVWNKRLFGCSRTIKVNPWLSGGSPLLPFSGGNLLILQPSISNELSKFIAKETSQLSKLLL